MKKIILFSLILVILFFASDLFYNQSRKTFAQFNIPEIGKLLIPELSEETMLNCERKIPLGEIIDNSEDIAQRVINEIEKIEKEIPKITEGIPKEIDNANNLSRLPDCSICSQWCSCSCSPIMMCCAYSPTGGCTRYCCIGCRLTNPCQGNPCSKEKEEIEDINKLIQENHQKITDVFNNITAVDDEIHNLIKGEEVHNKELIGKYREPTWAYNILNKELPYTRKELSRCLTPYIEASEMARKGELLSGKWFLSCENVKGQGILQECYPNNYFCCQ